MFWIAVSVGIITLGLLVAYAMQQAGRVALIRHERAEKAAIRSHEETQKLFDVDLARQRLEAEARAKKESNIGLAEAEIAKKQRAEVEYNIEQTRLARSFVEQMGTSWGEKLMEGHRLTESGVLEAIRRQLDGEEPRPGTIERKAS